VRVLTKVLAITLALAFIVLPCFATPVTAASGFDMSKVNMVIILLEKNAAWTLGNGHIALICVDSSGFWKSYSFAPKDLGASFNDALSKLKNEKKLDLTVIGKVTTETGSYATLKSRLSSKTHIFGGIAYDNWYARIVSATAGAKIAAKAEAWFKSPPNYSIGKFNCDHFTSQCTGAGSIPYYVYNVLYVTGCFYSGPGASFDNIYNTWYKQSKIGIGYNGSSPWGEPVA